MNWWISIAIEAVLAVCLCVRRDSRKWFQALICCNLAFELAYAAYDRAGAHSQQAQIWWLLVVAEIPLYALCLLEAGHSGGQRHRLILCWWVALTMGCAWIRFYPYTGAATVIINEIAFMLWLADKFLLERSMLISGEM